MREIKFRAYIKEFTQMLEVEYLHVIAEEVEVRRFPNILTSLFSYAKEFEDAVLMQYTGLKDKNGKEIYEGDLLLRHRNAPPIMEEVQYGSSTWLLVGEDGGIFLDVINQHCEVMGNIYENPELLDM
jgi:uncharacterized phage protein (TIGR01671 family)